MHRVLGPGLLELHYETALCIELNAACLPYVRQSGTAAYYKGHCLGHCRVDLIVADRVLVEVKAAERLNPLFEAQLLAYLRLTRMRVGLLINFNSRLLKEGIKRMVL